MSVEHGEPMMRWVNRIQTGKGFVVIDGEFKTERFSMLPTAHWETKRREEQVRSVPVGSRGLLPSR